MKNKLNKSVEWCPVCGDEDTYESAEGVFVASCKSCGRPLMLCEKCFERYGNDRPCGEGCPASRAYDELLEAFMTGRVPSHGYELTLADGREIVIDIACEEDWGNVQPCLPDDCEDWENSVGWGNDEDGHEKIVDVYDCETETHLDPSAWAEERVWCYAKYYSA